MLCDNCKENEAIISYTKMQGNNVEEVHLCADCAEKKMHEDFLFNKVIGSQVDSLLKEIFKLTGHLNQEVIQKECPSCKTTFKEFEQGRLGCEDCYNVFESEITNMLNSLKYVSKHTGKIPASADDEIVKRREKNDLKTALQIAIEKEDYEQAAIIRDKLKELR